MFWKGLLGKYILSWYNWWKFRSSWTVSSILASLFFCPSNIDIIEENISTFRNLTLHCTVTTGVITSDTRKPRRAPNPADSSTSSSEFFRIPQEQLILCDIYNLHDHCTEKGRRRCNKHVGLFYQCLGMCVLISVMHWQRRGVSETHSQLLSDHHKSYWLWIPGVMRNWEDDGEIPQVSYHFAQCVGCSAWVIIKEDITEMLDVVTSNVGTSHLLLRADQDNSRRPVICSTSHRLSHCDDCSHPELVWDLAALFYDLIF